MHIALRTLQVIVKNSAVKLDKEVKGWHKQVDVLRLRLASAYNCMAGQLKLWDKFPTCKSASKRGFYLDKDITKNGAVIASYDNLENYDILTRLWKHQIAIRGRKDSQVKSNRGKPLKNWHAKRKVAKQTAGLSHGC